MNRYLDSADSLIEVLALALPPIAVAFVDEPPAGVAALTTPAPSACAIWRLAETQTFYASSESHAGCAVGSHVMGFSLSDETSQALAGSAQFMAETGYMAPDEVAQLPRVREHHEGIVYGPLGAFPIAADAALLWVRPAQAMLLEEALGGVRWTGEGGASRVLGRPGCGVLAVAVNTGQAARTVGCIGMRTFTGVPDDLSPFVLPGVGVDAVAERLRSVHSSNGQMLDHYRAQLAQFKLATTGSLS